MDPMLATSGPLPTGPQWCYEVKWDGMRLMADVTTKGTSDTDVRRLRLLNTAGREMTRYFPELAELADVTADVLLDGEAVLLVDGVPSSAALAERCHRVATPAEVAARPVVFVVFDVLRLYGVSLLERPFSERRATLERLDIAGRRGICLSPVYDDGHALFTATAEHGLDGVVAKRRDSVYRPGARSPHWISVAHRHTQNGRSRLA